MSGQGAPAAKTISRPGLHVTIVASSWHEQVMNGLIEGAKRACKEAEADCNVVTVPGSFELPLGAQQAIAAGTQAVVALGVVIRGGTPHFDYVCAGATNGLMRAMLDSGIPVGFGLLTCDTEEQALARAGLPDSVEDKGYEAAQAAMMMVTPS